MRSCPALHSGEIPAQPVDGRQKPGGREAKYSQGACEAAWLLCAARLFCMCLLVLTICCGAAFGQGATSRLFVMLFYVFIPRLCYDTMCCGNHCMGQATFYRKSAKILTAWRKSSGSAFKLSIMVIRAQLLQCSFFYNQCSLLASTWQHHECPDCAGNLLQASQHRNMLSLSTQLSGILPLRIFCFRANSTTFSILPAPSSGLTLLYPVSARLPSRFRLSPCLLCLSVSLFSIQYL